MQVPRRRSEQSIKRDTGPFLVTREALERLQGSLKHLEGQIPHMISEVEYTKSHGDFSENAACQDAKATLRRTYNRIESIKDRIKRAEIIEKGPSNGKVQIGSTVVLELAGKKHTFEILGSHESNPGKGRISNTSPLGAALMGHEAGDDVVLEVKTGSVHYRILEIR
jgi:transcription elongation factor GreA